MIAVNDSIAQMRESCHAFFAVKSLISWTLQRRSRIKTVEWNKILKVDAPDNDLLLTLFSMRNEWKGWCTCTSQVLHNKLYKEQIEGQVV